MTAGTERSGTDLTVTTTPAGLSVTSDGAAGPVEKSGTDAQLITTLRSLRELGRFEEAAVLVRAADAQTRPSTMSAATHAAAGPALAAVSDYAAAGVHLLMASIDPVLAPQALGRLAEIAWIEHDHAQAQAYALAGLTLDPSHRLCRIQLRRNEIATVAEREPPAAPGTTRLAHAAFFADPQGNAGDRVLTDAVRRCFTGGIETAPEDPEARPVAWHDVHVHQLFDEPRLAEVNATDGLVLGGGGLFLPDTAPNGHSGWQWNVPDDVLARIDVPLAVFAVGYNLFEGQTFEPDGRFARSLRTLVERAAFVGLRNHGSVDRVRELLPGHLAERVGWQPCPTTITDLLSAPISESAAFPRDHARMPAVDNPAAGLPGEPGPVLLNCAYDRAGRRFGDGYGAFLAALRDWVVDTREIADVGYAAHCVDDERFVGDLRREHGLTLPVIPMYDLSPARIQAHYRRARLVVGMRGHAGMIPFGCGTPIISLISHPKLGYFLADIDRPQWGVSVREPHLAQRLSELTTELLDSGPEVAADIRRIRRRLADVTLQNLRSLPSSFDPARAIRQDETDE